jgi:cytolysin-activating lysine-acyltransferase
MADDLVARRIDGGETPLTAVEWKSGSNLRIVDIIAPFGAEAEMREQASSTQSSRIDAGVLAGRSR